MFNASPETTSYPPAPWRLKGKAVQSLQPIDVAIARPTLPPELKIVQVFPGKTLGGVYLARYGDGSDLMYHELIVVSAIVHYADRVGVWVSHIYVDNPRSVAGGKLIWGLPKELAEFEWIENQPGATHSEIIVAQADQQLLKLTYSWSIPGILQPWIPTASFSTRSSDLLWFSASAKAQPCFLPSTTITIPSGSPISGMGLHQPWLTFAFNPLQLQANEPLIVGSTATSRV